MTRKRTDQGPSLFDWADAQPMRALKIEETPAEVESVAAEPARHGGARPAPQSRPRAQIVDFIERRESLPRFILCQPAPFAGLDREIARKEGRLPPAPVLKLRARSPTSSGSYSPESERRQG